MLLKFIKSAIYGCGAIACIICGAAHKKCTSKNGVCPGCVAKGLG